MDTSFKSLSQIVEIVSEQVQKVNKGELDLSQIELLTLNAQELYERLVVIRHKAFEKLADNQPKEIKNVNISPTEKKVEQDDLFFDLTQEDSNSTNDAEAEMLFDFSQPEAEIKNESSTTIKDIDLKSESASTKSLNDKFASNNSLNEVFKTTQKNSLADKLKYAPISDLKSHININQKFLFVSKLFNGDNEIYNQMIEKLNNQPSGDDARELLNELSVKNNWDVEDENVIDFVEIVERRYL